MKSLTLNCFISLIPAVIFAFVAFAAMYIFRDFYPLVIRSTVPIIIGFAVFAFMFHELIKEKRQ